MNDFFRRQLTKLVTTTLDFENGANHNNIPADFAEQEEKDWYNVQYADDVGKRVSGAIEAIYRSDGRIGFKFTPNALKLFVNDSVTKDSGSLDGITGT